jgi:uncharacterized membrane protein YbhN (UPF0104 family)
VLALVFTSAGVPGQTAVVVSISYRILTVWIPLVIGFFCTRRMGIFRGVLANGSSSSPAEQEAE